MMQSTSKSTIRIPVVGAWVAQVPTARVPTTMVPTTMILATMVLASMVLAVGCPKSGPILGRVSDRTLASDAQKLGPRLRQAKLGHSARLLEAYLAHFRGKVAERNEAICQWLQLTSLTPTAATAHLSSVEPPSRRRMRAFLAVLLKPRTCRKAHEPTSADAPLNPGIYSFNETKTALSGDTLTVQERWMIRRKGDRIWGWYIRRMDRQSGDGRSYRCSRNTRYGVVMAFTFVGRPQGASFVLEETDAFVQPGPCAPKQIRLDRCVMRPLATGLQLNCPRSRRLTRMASLPAPGASGGVFQWTGPTTPRADGTRQRVIEQWHLLELGGKLHGFYTRHQKVTARARQTHKCNGKKTFERKRLYLVGGTRTGAAITLHELTALHRPGPCADTKVRLDTYRGSLSGGVLSLSWGQGSQSLKRDPTKETQALPLGWMPKTSTPKTSTPKSPAR